MSEETFIVLEEVKKTRVKFVCINYMVQSIKVFFIDVTIHSALKEGIKTSFKENYICHIKQEN